MHLSITSHNIFGAAEEMSRTIPEVNDKRSFFGMKFVMPPRTPARKRNPRLQEIIPQGGTIDHQRVTLEAHEENSRTFTISINLKNPPKIPFLFQQFITKNQ